MSMLITFPLPLREEWKNMFEERMKKEMKEGEKKKRERKKGKKGKKGKINESFDLLSYDLWVIFFNKYVEKEKVLTKFHYINS